MFERIDFAIFCSRADARDLADVSQTFHPCGCYNPHGVQFCAGVELAQGFGETSMGPLAGPNVTPPQWPLGSQQETAFNMYANHGGGYVYMLCKRTDFLQCQKDLSEPIRSSTREQVDAYLKCLGDRLSTRSKLITIHDNHTIRWFALINQVWNRLGI